MKLTRFDKIFFETIKSWANSKLGLLIIGAIISGILIPTFQYTQRFLEWRRENQYREYSENLKNRKLLLQKFIESKAYLAESKVILYDFYLSKDKSQIDRNALVNKISNIQSKTFLIYNEINYLLLETESNAIKKEYELFLELNGEYTKLLKKIIIELSGGSLTKNDFDELEQTSKKINNSYDSLEKSIKNNIKETNDENKHFHLF